MGRTIITGLQPLLDLVSCRTDTTLDLILKDTSELHFSTDAFTANGDTYTADLRIGGEIQQSISTSPNRLQATIQNVDKGLSASIDGEDLISAEGIVGRYYRDPAGVLAAKWVELFRGTVLPLGIDETGLKIEIVNDLAAAGYCVGNWTVSEPCQNVFKDPATCGYSGGLTTCNKKRKSPDGCFGRDNEHRFNGMEFPEAQAAEVGSGGAGGGTGGGTGGGWGCFIGSTMIDLNESLAITFERLYRLRKTYIGGQILSFDDDGNVRSDVLLEVVRHWVYEYLEVKFVGDETPTGTTREHPFWTRQRQFVPMGKLSIGDRVHDRNGRDWKYPAIEGVWRIRVPKGLWIYNLTTRDFHRYFANRKAVHNSKPLDP